MNRSDDVLQPVNFTELMEKAEETNKIMPETIVTDFKTKTAELFRSIDGMTPADIEETVKCYVQAKIDECNFDATLIDAVITGSRCRCLETEQSDLDVVVELQTTEREDDLFNAFNQDGLQIGGVKVDINPITAQRTGTLQTYLPKVEEYLESVLVRRITEIASEEFYGRSMSEENLERFIEYCRIK